MKTKLVFSLILVGLMGLILSCASAPKELSPEHERLIGTKWVTIDSASGDSLVFTNASDCTLTYNGRPQFISYKVQGNQVILGNNIFVLVLREDTFYIAGLPMFIRA